MHFPLFIFQYACCEELVGTQEAEDRAGLQASVEEVLGLFEGHRAAVLCMRRQRTSQ